MNQHRGSYVAGRSEPLTSVAQARNTYENAKAATEEATDLLKGTYKTAAKGATDYNLKVIEIARTNTNGAFDYAYKLLGCSPYRSSLSCQPRMRTSSSRR